MEEFDKQRVPKNQAERMWPMRHFMLVSIIGLTLVGVGCAPFDKNEGSGGSGGSGGAGSNSSASSTASSSVSTSSSTASTTGSSSSASSSDASSSVSTGTGMVEFFSCADVAATDFVVKVHADVVPSNRQIRLGGQVVYPAGQGFMNTNWGVRGTGPVGENDVMFDLGVAPSGATANLTLGTIGPNETTPNPDGIVDGNYYCPNSKPYACGIDIIGCYGSTEIGRYVNGVGSGGFAFMTSAPNPTFVTP